MTPILNGSRIPAVPLARLEKGVLQTVYADRLLAYGRAVVMGIPGAFTPVCTQRHIPEFTHSAERLTATGYSHLICIAPNDPFVLEAWSRQVDPSYRIDFYSDGNLEFTRALGVIELISHLYLGWRSSRYLMVVADGVIQRLRIEKDAVDYHCTQPQQLLCPDPAE
jgi:peroxiredoxin